MKVTIGQILDQGLLNKIVDAGIRTTTWNGRDAYGDEAASGVYFARLEFDGSVETRNLVLLK